MSVLQRPAMETHWPTFAPTSTAQQKAPNAGALLAPTITTPDKHRVCCSVAPPGPPPLRSIWFPEVRDARSKSSHPCPHAQTELCKLYMRTRSCPYGAGCQFAHGHHELKPKQHSRSFKTQLCKNFWELNCQCRYAANDRCQYIHDEPERVAAVLLSHAPAALSTTSLRFPSPHTVYQHNSSHNLNGLVAWFANTNLPGCHVRHVSEPQLRFAVGELLARQTFGAGAAPPAPPGPPASPPTLLSPFPSPRLAPLTPPDPSPPSCPLPLLARPLPQFPRIPPCPFSTHPLVPPLPIQYLISGYVQPYSAAADYTFTSGALSPSLYASSQSSTSDFGSGGGPSPLGSRSSAASVLSSPAQVSPRMPLQRALSPTDLLAAPATPLSFKDVPEQVALWVLDN